MTTDTKKVNERELAVDILLMVTRDGVHSHLALGEVLDKYRYLEKKSRAFITRLVQGTLERMLELDWVLDQYSKTPVKKMKPLIRCIMRSSVYQLLYMDSVPASAACNEAVKLAAKRGFSGLKGFVNGVLRSISRGKEAGLIRYPDEASDPWLYLSIRYSMPRWILELWNETYDYETIRRMCEDMFAHRPTAIRIAPGVSMEALTKELTAAGISVEQTELNDALLISGYDYLGNLPAFVRGDFYVQDLSCMQAMLAPRIQKGWNIIDVCGAPGGKAIHGAQLMDGSGHVEARDISEYKADLIRENLARTHTDNVTVKVWDATVEDPDVLGSADLVIADLPCSGLGVLHGKPEIKYRMSRQQLEELAALQRQILSVVQAYVKPGGRLIYSTCTVSPMENEGNVSWFENQYPVFKKCDECQLLPDTHRDGFFYALFTREE